MLPAEWQSDAAVIGRSTSYHMVSPLNSQMKNKMMYETGNLPWILFHYYQYCIYTENNNELTTNLFPILKRSMAYYEHIRELRNDGKYHLPETASPEYATAKDCNYDLSLLRWGLTTLLNINKKYHLNDSKVADWTDFLSNLTDYPVDEQKGLMIGEGGNLTGSHRHYSHLLMIYPLNTFTPETAQNRAMIEKSVAHWQSMPAYLQGYSFTGSSSIYSILGDGDRAVAQLQKLVSRFIQPNTLYRETGPVIETPLAGAASLQELYLQSWNGKIRVFPAVPTSWNNASFIDFRCEGAFLVSASRENGKTTTIQIKSEKGGVCQVVTGMDNQKIRVVRPDGKKVKYSMAEDNALIIDTRPGDIILMTDRKGAIQIPQAVSHPQEYQNSFGFRKSKLP